MARWGKQQLIALTAFHKGLDLPVVKRSSKKPAKVRVACESEMKAQIRLSAWMHNCGIWHYAVPNGANVAVHHRRSLLDQGMSPGVPDICVPYARHGYNALYIELKREDGGAGLSDNQRAWIEFLNAEGYLAVEMCGFDYARAKIEWYLG